jgi:hypothetical protein
MMQTFTLTFGDVAENHARMEKIGDMSERGFSFQDMWKMKRFFERFTDVEFYHLNRLLPGGDEAENAYLLVVRGGVDILLGEGKADDLFEEQDSLEKDTKAFMYGRVVNKKARHNLCFGEESREADYENGKGTIVGYDEVPITAELREKIEEVSGTPKLVIEGNYYYDVKKCFISCHGDSERRKVVGVRLGKSFKFHYQWYSVPEYDEKETEKAKKKNVAARDRYVKRMLGKRLELTLNHGDLYVMSEKAVGTDWMDKKKITLRHAAGDVKVLKDLNVEFTTGEDLLFECKYKIGEDGYVNVVFD